MFGIWVDTLVYLYGVNPKDDVVRSRRRLLRCLLAVRGLVLELQRNVQLPCPLPLCLGSLVLYLTRH